MTERDAGRAFPSLPEVSPSRPPRRRDTVSKMFSSNETKNRPLGVSVVYNHIPRPLKCIVSMGGLLETGVNILEQKRSILVLTALIIET